jgi:hypothetical protein
MPTNQDYWWSASAEYAEGDLMISLQDAVRPVLSLPTPAALVTLQGALLASEQRRDEAARALETTGHFHAYLSELQSKVSARSYSELASRLDIGAIGAVALENIVAAEKENFWSRFLLGGVAEALMIAASRQYIKGWEVETGLVHTQAAWYLTEALWQTSAEMQPGLAPEERWQAIQALLAPANASDVPAPDKAVLLGRIFQILLLTHLAPLLTTTETKS